MLSIPVQGGIISDFRERVFELELQDAPAAGDPAPAEPYPDSSQSDAVSLSRSGQAERNARGACAYREGPAINKDKTLT